MGPGSRIRIPRRRMRKIDKIIIHCSATPEGRDVKTETIRKWHLDRGWSDIGYHYVIELDGSLHIGRPIERTGAHCKGHNTGSIGVCYIGGVDQDMKPKDTRTEAQRDTLHSLLFDLTDNFAGATIHGHNEFSSKACPSFNVQTEL
jgi:N-acetylmuramoyl-L-alanine amidase